ncbi:MAG: FKBP-type peptidyl-prolyl cis-trans isomerase [Flavobacteriales bacterium]|nr:FKBP-type peptidyl-prolyl cis-trans isomerase [Flavobacteriales bacterium]
MKAKFVVQSILLLFVFVSCSETEEKKPNRITQKQLKRPLEEINKTMHSREMERIKAYISRRNWDMTKTGTGLQYDIYESGDGIQPQKGNRVKVNFDVELLDGTKCYSSDEKGAIMFLVGRDNMESGIHEGILLMKVGDKARFVMPAHLAHGFVGDDKKIPKQSTVVYDIELLAIY